MASPINSNPALNIGAGKIAFEPWNPQHYTPAQSSGSTRRWAQSLKHFLGFFLILGVIIFCIFFYTWQRVQILRLGYAIEKLEAQKSEAILQHKQLRIELAALKSPAHLERLAAERLGMTRPKGGQVVFLTPKK